MTDGDGPPRRVLGEDEVHRRLGFHPAGPVTAPMYEVNRALAILVAETWDQLLPPGREAACAMTALQEALMWANAAVACNVDGEEGLMPPVDASTALDEVLDRLEGPEYRRNGPIAAGQAARAAATLAEWQRRRSEYVTLDGDPMTERRPVIEQSPEQ